MVSNITDPRILSWWTETDLRTDSLHQSDWAPGTDLVLLIAYMSQYSLEINISSFFFFCTSGKETVEDLKISRGQLAPCQENPIKRQQAVRSAGCKVLVPNTGF